jgi:hypothetical protein
VLLERAMLAFLTRFLLIVISRLRSQARLEAENLVLRRQVLILSRKSPSRARLRNLDRLILVWLYRLFPSILNAITVVKPETVMRWHQRGFRAYWHWKSRWRGGRPKMVPELRAVIRRMSRENPLWGSVSSEGWRVQRETVPPRQRASSLVAWMAGRRETNDLKPIDRVVERTTASHRAAA